MPEPKNVTPLLLALDFEAPCCGGGNAVRETVACSPTCPLTPNADASTDLKIIRSLIHELLQGEQPAAIESALVVL